MLFFARLDIAGLCEYFNNLVPTCIWYRSIVKILTRVDWCHIMIDNMRYISLLAASIYNTCYISRACTPLSIDASICLAYITRVIHLFMHYTLHLYGWRRRACALTLVLARLCLRAAGGVGTTAALVGRCRRHRLRLLCLSCWWLRTAYMNGWRRAFYATS